MPPASRRSATRARPCRRSWSRPPAKLALVGPNCYGLLNYFDGVALWADQHGGKPLERGVAIVSQSGNISLNLTMAGRSVPLGYVISVGNQAALGIGDYLEALVEDPRITAIGLYMEGLSDVAGFSRAAARALEKNIPIVALKVGTSDIGAQVALSHTSSLAGSDQLYEALFARLGIIRVRVHRRPAGDPEAAGRGGALGRARGSASSPALAASRR